MLGEWRESFFCGDLFTHQTFSIMGLPITGQHYNLISLAFYVGFLIWEFPTVYISQKLRVAKYLGMCIPPYATKPYAQGAIGGNIIIWGIILMLHAAATSFGSFFALRFLLGKSCSEHLRT